MWRRVFTDNLPIKLLALLLAVALWMLARGLANVRMDVSVPVSLVNVPKELMVRGRVPDQVHFTVSGSKISLLGFHPERLALVLDAANLGAGSVSFTGLEKRLELPPDITILRVYPATIQVNFAQR